MSRRLRLWLVVSGAVLLHFFLHVGMGLGRGAPDLLLVGLLLGSRSAGMAVGAGGGFVLGMMEDAFSLLAFGANTLALTLVGLAGGATRDLFIGDSKHFYFWYLALGKWSRDVVHWVMAGDIVRGPFVETILLRAPVDAAYAAIVGVAILASTRLGREVGG